MTNVLGFRLDQATDYLRLQGYEVRTMEISSKKGVAGGEKRVVRQQYSQGESGGVVILTYAAFRTECAEA